MQVRLESMAYGADAIGRVDGKAVFVEGGVPGDLVEVEVTQDGPSFSKGRVTQVIEPSPDRVKPRCPYAGVCGGCPWSNMTYEAQVRAKAKNVRDTLHRIGKLDDETLDAVLQPLVSPGDEWGYRNKVELDVAKVNGRTVVGMHGRGDDDALVPVDSCLLLDSHKKNLMKSVTGAMKYLASKNPDLGVERIAIRSSRRTKQLEVSLWTDTGPFPRAEVAKVLKDAANPTSISRIMTKEKKAARRVSGVECLDGWGCWEELVLGNRMRFSAPAFFQVNTKGADALVKLALEALDPQEGELAVDLYCGAGTFTIPLANTGAEVIAVEVYGPAVRDLKRNLEINNLQDAVEAIGDDAARQLDCLEDADVIVVDPPRAGLDKSVVEALSASPARSIAYVSCDPATLARDLKYLGELGTHAIRSITPVDLFPQTYHVETVTILDRR